MALTTCWECKAEISTSAESCPKCGAKRKKPTSGCALIAAGLFAIICVSALGRACSDTSSNSASINSSPSTTPLSAPISPAKPDPVALLTESNRHVDEIDSRFKEYSTRLKKFYGTPDQVKQVTTDLVALAVIKGSYGESKAKDEVALSKRAASLLDDGALLQRRIYASASEEIFVKNGMDVRVSAAGKNKDQLRLSYVLMSKPLVYQFQNEMKLSETARTLGFKKVIYTDGYDETWTVEL